MSLTRKNVHEHRISEINTKSPEAWDEIASQNAMEMKMAITKYPMSRQFDPMRRIYICMDASCIAIVVHMYTHGCRYLQYSTNV
jgi:hypothetical protein